MFSLLRLYWNYQLLVAWEFSFKICLWPERKGEFLSGLLSNRTAGRTCVTPFRSVLNNQISNKHQMSNKFFCYCTSDCPCCAFSPKSFMHSLSVSSFSISLLHLKHNREDTSCSFSTRIPNTEDNVAATFCFEVSPSNKSHVMHRCICHL